jgi:ribulose-phosphate 3-epimerase
VDPTTAPRCVDAGATLLVAGSHVFGAPDPAERYSRLAASVGAV